MLNITAGEQCDDGNTADGDGCSSTCQLSSCGDGVVDSGEGCDDGGTLDGDGCSSTCQVDTGWTCTGTPSACQYIARNADAACNSGGLTCSGSGGTDHNDAECYTVNGTGPFSLTGVRYEIGQTDSKATVLNAVIYDWDGSGTSMGTVLDTRPLPAPAIGAYTETFATPVTLPDSTFCVRYESDGRFSLAADTIAPFNFPTGNSFFECVGTVSNQSLDTLSGGTYRRHWCAEASVVPQ